MSWSEEEVLKFYRNSLRFQTYGNNMEHFLGQTGFLTEGKDLNQAIEDYCEQLKVPEKVHIQMHVLRKNRNLAAHESISSINKMDALELDYYDLDQVEGYRKYYKNAQNMVENFISLSQQDDLQDGQKIVMEDEEDDETETWTKKEVKTFYTNAMRFKTYGMNMEHFLQEVGAMKGIESHEKIFGGIEQYCDVYNVPEKVKSQMHIIRKNRNLVSHEGKLNLNKESVLALNYYNLRDVEGYRRYRNYAEKCVRKWKIFVKKSKGMSDQEIKIELKKQQEDKVCELNDQCRNNECEKDHTDGKFCNLGKNCRNRQCCMKHSSCWDIFVTGLPGDVNTDKVKALFEQEAGTVTYCKFQEKNNKGIAFLTFASELGFQKALELDRSSPFDSRKMYVKQSDR